MKAINRLIYLLFLFAAVPLSAFASFEDPLIDNADLGNYEKVVSLLEQGYYVDYRGEFGVSALMRAAYRGHTNITKLLIEEGADVNAADVGGATPLHLAARNGYADVIRVLLSYDAEIDAPDKEQWTPLMRAVMSRQKEVVQTLIRAGADVAKVNDANESALVMAASGDSPELVEIILNSPGVARISPGQRQSALAAAQGKNQAIIRQGILQANQSMPAAEPEAPTAIRLNNTPLPVLREETVLPAAKQPMPALPAETEGTPWRNAPVASAPAPLSVLSAPAQPVTALPPASEEAGPAGIMPEEIPPAMKPASVAVPQPEKPVIPEMPHKPSPVPASRDIQKTGIFNKQESFKPMEEETFPGQEAVAGEVPPVGHYIQLGAFGNEDEALYTWTSLKNMNQAVFRDMQPRIIRAYLTPSGRMVYRLRVGPFMQRAEAQEVCTKLRGRDIECFIVESSDVGTLTPAPVLAPQNTTMPAAPEQRVMPSVPEQGIPQPEEIVPYPEPEEPVAPLPILPEQQGAIKPPAKIMPRIVRQVVDLPWKNTGNQADVPARPIPLVGDGPTQQTETISSSRYESVEPGQFREQPVEGTPWRMTSGYPDRRAAPPVQMPVAPAAPKAATPPAPQPKSTGDLPKSMSRPADQDMEKEIRAARRKEFIEQHGLDLPLTSEEKPDFYQGLEGQHAEVAEAIPVPKDEDYLKQGWQQARSNEPAIAEWVEITAFASETQAQDYWLRTFKFDQAYTRLNMGLTQVPMGGFGLKIWPVGGEDQAICNIARASGLQCKNMGRPSTAPAAVPVAPEEQKEEKGKKEEKKEEKKGDDKQKEEKKKEEVQEAKTPEGFWIYFGTFPSIAASEYYWTFLQEDNQDLLRGNNYNMLEKGIKDQPDYSVRLRTGPFESGQRAQSLCDNLRRRNIGCLVSR